MVYREREGGRARPASAIFAVLWPARALHQERKKDNLQCLLLFSCWTGTVWESELEYCKNQSPVKSPSCSPGVMLRSPFRAEPPTSLILNSSSSYASLFLIAINAKHLGLSTHFEAVKKDEKRQEKVTAITAKPLLQMRSVGNGNTESIFNT